ncbi:MULTISPECIES: M50 family metallopeptidase [unclassified Leptolyngbya]|uniref:M50 family metallopeptidase n=1 Tax=unclassified Leptolyngbya TaxID=2650499 RepID=UPI0016873D36|nr:MULTISPECIES: M50 family metallopeptidase [unclassified Leptolyngbya]MBD1911174.1 hypothetical protein [Leptolyngbya sp. FACHB-8]MBD2154829.1 hypothetical protein [Leptolyngbya sp. FACHB-16]
MSFILGLFLHLFAAFAWPYFSIFCHEHGHFFAAKLVGFRPYHLKIGSRTSITWKWLFNSKIELGSYPGGGLTFASMANIDGSNFKTLKLRTSIFLLGGAFANLLLFLMSLTAFCLHPSILLLFFIYIELYLIIYSLFPMNVMIGGVKHPNDGKILQTTLKKNYQEYYRNAAISYQEAISAYGDLPRKRSFLGGDPNRLQLLIDAQVAVLYEHYDEAVKLLEQLLELGSLDKIEIAYILDTLLSIVINNGQMQYLTQADHWSERAIKAAGHSKTIQGTRGAILAELGRYAEAKKMLLPLTEPGQEAIDFTISCWYLAKIDYHLGNSEKVRYWLKQAEQFGSDSASISSILDRILNEIGEKP